ncbi:MULTISPECIES: hypothetical protein [unclassified Streptomyces]|uniref:hypothetical protein n=1 Tax=unclassified Streptomyces TaxID=2593676 RepID=UPI0001C19419|nr:MULTISPECIES: hypothetical protein [unclassified Streptomyces]AEN10795.1 hypothetical protein SACTE_2922 [Streptomyces sp. SirexAA-E]MYR69196.1 hypothetical protein [Streptomyces sp. SID4939]MYR99922.1 hypothetical protein [Streptomyces sp. SID4940]MYT63939.1 hypothetical protein [Streptomyces sp. SID8357]MYT86189.1 hypothetical protein [Streptomyces sp. SID8360]
MTTGPTESLPVPQEDPIITAGLGIAAKWGEVLGAEKLDVALKAMEPQLKREHQLRLRQLENQRLRAEQEDARAEAERERAAALAKAEGERAARDAEKRRNHVFRMSGLITGAVLALCLLGAGVAVAPAQPWLAAGLCGPSLLAVLKIVVLRRSDAADMKATERIAREAAASAAPPLVP